MMRPLLTLALLASPIAAIAQAPAPTGSKPPIMRTDLQRHDLATAGREMLQTRIDFEPGAAAPMHSHPGEEVIYVLAGTLEYEIKGSSPVTLKAGDVLFVPANRSHSARNVGTDRGSELATYIVEKGKPLLVLDK